MRRIASVLIVLSSICLTSLFFSCGSQSPYSSKVTSALSAAGGNRTELEKVLSHYVDRADSLKLEAALFLIANMPGHSYVTYYFHDSTDRPIEFNVLDYPDFSTLLTAIDSIEKDRGEIDYDRRDTYEDVETISAEFLIEQIDYAFRAWREKPWARGFSFDEFCRYILPYRGSNEPLEPWRQTFWDKYAGTTAEMADSTDPIEAASLINRDLTSWFKFDERYYLHPTDQGLAEMLENKMGRCEDMTNVTIYALRANGLAVTSDYTPHWANTGNNHAWNSIVTAEGEVIPFMGAEANPGEYKLFHKAAKVYRKTFDEQPENLAFQDHKQKKVPGWLAGKNYADVTSDYVGVCDVSITFEEGIPDSVDLAYLCVFNSGQWRAIHWGRIEKEVAMFTDMGTDVAYLPALYVNEEILPYGEPFVLGNDCSIREYSPNDGETISVALTATTKRTLDRSTDGITQTDLTAGKMYELFYFDGGWQSVDTAIAGKEPLVFEDVPAGCLYWLVVEDSGEEERIFTIEDGRQVWW